MLQCHFKPFYELTSSGKSGVVSRLLFGSVAGIFAALQQFSVQFSFWHIRECTQQMACRVT